MSNETKQSYLAATNSFTWGGKGEENAVVHANFPENSFLLIATRTAELDKCSAKALRDWLSRRIEEMDAVGEIRGSIRRGEETLTEEERLEHEA